MRTRGREIRKIKGNKKTNLVVYDVFQFAQDFAIGELEVFTFIKLHSSPECNQCSGIKIKMSIHLHSIAQESNILVCYMVTRQVLEIA